MLDKGKMGGKLCSLKLNIHANKPDIVILTETRHNADFQGQKILKGYNLIMNSSSGNRTSGVLVYARKTVQIMENSVYNSDTGHFAIGCLIMNGVRIILAAIYGPSTNSDPLSFDIFRQISQEIQTRTQAYNTSTIVLAGDFNLHLDTTGRKPRTCQHVRGLMDRYNMIDAGHTDKLPTWRRPHRAHLHSRLDYIMHSNNILGRKVNVRWSQLDHAQITCQLEVGAPTHKKVIYKDWILGQTEFQQKAEALIAEVLIDHSQHQNMNAQDRQESFGNKHPKEYEASLLLTDEEEGIFHAHILSIIIQKVTQLHTKIQKDLSGKKIREMQGKQDRITYLYRQLDTQEQNQVRTEILEDIEQTQQELRQEAEEYEKAKQQRVDHFYQTNNGKNTAASFVQARPEKVNRVVSKLTVDNTEISDPQEINRVLQDKHKDMVSKEFQQEMQLEEFLTKYQVTLPELSQDSKELLDEEFQIEEVRQALKQADNNSAPGPSGQTIGVFKYIFSIIPETMTRALNELTFVPGLHESACFKWLKERHIIYIPKVGKPADRPENLRPLSLLETLYKIQTRILSTRLVKTLDQVLVADQHGFRPGRSTQTCSLPFLETIHEANSTGKPLQLLSIDIKSAFDSISPELVKQVMHKLGYPVIYLEALHGWTGKGTARVLVNSVLGPEFKLRTGTGQGDPPSAPRYDIGADPLLRAVQQVVQNFRYTMNTGRQVPFSAYADDQMGALSVQSSQQVKDIIQVYEDYSKVSGLKINVKKTEILCINTTDQLRQNIQEDTGIQVVTGLRHLGIELKTSYHETVQASFSKAMERTESRYNRINMSHADMFHKRQLITQAYTPSFTHLFMTLEYDPQAGQELDKKVRKLLWTKTERGVTNNKRHLVSKKRLGAGFEYGGLQISSSNETAKSLACNFIQKMLLQATVPESEKIWMFFYFNDLLGKIGSLPLTELYKIGGQQIWNNAANKIKRYSPFLSHAMHSFASLTKLNEGSREWLSASIAGHGSATHMGGISEGEGFTLLGYGFTHVGQLFATNNLTGQINTAEDTTYPDLLAQRHPWTIIKCKALRRELAGRGGHLPPPPCSFSTAIASLKFSGLYRKLKRAKINDLIKAPPSYITRQKDGLSVPSLSEYMSGYKRIFGMGLPSKTLETSFHVLNRQTWTNNKWYLSQRGEGGDRSKQCTLCGATENTQHMIFECPEYSEIVWEVISEAINSSMDNQNNITIHMHNVMYNLPIKKLEKKHDNQIQTYIQEIKRNIIYRRYLRCQNPNRAQIIYNRDRIIAHCIITCKKEIAFRKYQNKNHAFLESIKHYLESQI